MQTYNVYRYNQALTHTHIKAIIIANVIAANIHVTAIAVAIDIAIDSDITIVHINIIVITTKLQLYFIESVITDV